MHVVWSLGLSAVLLGACVFEWPPVVAADGSTPVCGNGVVEPGETCDDGNTDDGDGCSATCVLEGNAECGNGVPESPEECDDGNTVDGDGCSATCTIEVPAECGNGVLEDPEQCDDGNTDDGDGCSATCLLEGATYSISGWARRSPDTSPLGDGSVGHLCVSVRTECPEITTEVGTASVYDADLSNHTTDLVNWSVAGLTSGTYYVYAFLNADSGPCDEALEVGDLSSNPKCQEVVVSGGDVTNVAIVFNLITEPW